MNNYIGLKWNGLKSYNFNNDFMDKNKKECERFINLWDEYFECSASCWGAEKHNENKNDLKVKICDSVIELFNLGVSVQNQWDDTFFNNENDIRKYLEESLNKEG